MNEHPDQPNLATPGDEPGGAEQAPASVGDPSARTEPVDASPFPRAETEEVLGGQVSPFDRAETEALLEAEHEHPGILGDDDGR